MWPREKKLKDIEIDRSSVETTLKSMRRALMEMEYHHPLLRMAECHVRHHGLNGEDKYTFISYELLSENERLHETVLQRLLREPIRMVIMPEGLKPGDIQPGPTKDTTAEDALLDIWLTISSLGVGPKGALWPVYTRTRDALIKCGRLQESATQPGRFEEIKRK